METHNTETSTRYSSDRLTYEHLLSAAKAYHELHPRAYLRQVADALDVSEAELISARVTEGSAVLLRPDFKGLLAGLEGAGRLMALTRNDSVVHERSGHYPRFVEQGPVGLFVSEAIDLRLFLNAWCYAFAVTDARGEMVRRSIQFFDHAGQAVHKVFFEEEESREHFEALVARFAEPDQNHFAFPDPDWQSEKPLEPCAPEALEDFRQAWVDLKDTHDFYGLIRRFGLSRVRALEEAPEGYARRLQPAQVETCLELAAERQVPVMVFVGNSGSIQIHTGTVQTLKRIPGWFNVLDPDFQLHLKTEDLAQLWWVRKPTVDGPVHSLEGFDAQGNLLISLFGARKPGRSELSAWRELLDTLCTSELAWHEA